MMKVKSLFDIYRGKDERATGGATYVATGGATADVVAEAVQILGQIVVDRATQAAYQEISTKIQEGLGCEEATRKKAEQTMAATWKLPATCQVLKTLRIQEIAMARQALLQALISDVTDEVFKTDVIATTDKKFVNLCAGAMVRAIIAAMVDPRHTHHVQIANALVDEFVSIANTYMLEKKDVYQDIDTGSKAAVLAAGAIIRCRVKKETDPALATCPISQYVDQLAQELDATPGEAETSDEANVRTSSRIIARGMLSALTAAAPGQSFGDNPAARERLHGATTALFESACFSLEKKPDACVAKLDYALMPLKAELAALATVRGMLDAGIDEDTNRMLSHLRIGVLGAAKTMPDSATATELSRPQQRALRLIGGVVQYAETYAVKSDASDKDLHTQRTKILESVTAEITDRTGREGDVIFSFGGSLGAVGGARLPLGPGKPVLATPLSLSLGFGMQKVATGGTPGLHLELGLVDLAQYVSFQQDPAAGGAVVVAKPDPLAMIAPSFKIGAQWKTQVPLFVAAGLSYAPLFKTGDENAPQKGALTLGLNIGAYVPLWDIN
jgi:hypothetical protein